MNEEIFLRSKPHMGLSVPLSARRICWPPPIHTVYRNNPEPALPATDRPPLLPLQTWKNYTELKVTLNTPDDTHQQLTQCTHVIHRHLRLSFIKITIGEQSLHNVQKCCACFDCGVTPPRGQTVGENHCGLRIGRYVYVTVTTVVTHRN